MEERTLHIVKEHLPGTQEPASSDSRAKVVWGRDSRRKGGKDYLYAS